MITEEKCHHATTTDHPIYRCLQQWQGHLFSQFFHYYYCYIYMHLYFSPFFQNTIQLPAFYHTQWAPHYPEFVHLRYNGAIYEIRVRQHKDKVYLAYGLQNFRKDLKIYESTNINFFACDHHSVFDIHFIPPLERQTCGRQRHSSRKHIWTLQLTQEMLDDPEPLVTWLSYLNLFKHIFTILTILLFPNYRNSPIVQKFLLKLAVTTWQS